MSEEAEVYDVSTEVKTGNGTEIKPFANDWNVEAYLNTVGTLELTDEQEKTLDARLDPLCIEVRPHDGVPYVPWMEYHLRLKKAFGRKWGLIPHGMPKFHGQFIYWGHYLVIDGTLAGYAIGEQRYIPSNKQMSYGDACEGAKSNALMRLCKGIGIYLEMWKPSYLKEWQTKYAEIGEDGKWRKKDAPTVDDDDLGPDPTKYMKGKKEKTQKEEPPPKGKFDSLKRFQELKKELNELTGKDDTYYLILGGSGFAKSNEITDKGEQVFVGKAMAAKVEELRLEQEPPMEKVEV